MSLMIHECIIHMIEKAITINRNSKAGLKKTALTQHFLTAKANIPYMQTYASVDKHLHTERATQFLRADTV